MRSKLILLALIFCIASLPAGAAVSPVNTELETPYVADRTDGCDGTDSRATITVGASGDYATIQDAVNAADPGDVIEIIDNPHTEGAQVTVNEDVTITGAGAGSTTVLPGMNTAADSSCDPNSAFIYVPAGFAVTVSNLTIDGTGQSIGCAIMSQGDLTVEGCDIRNISTSLYYGRAIGLIEGTGLIRYCSFENIARVGVHVRGGCDGLTPPTADIEHCTYTGKGAIECLDYAVEFGGGGSGSVTNSRFTNCLGVASDSSTSAGILITTYFGAGTSALVQGNVLSGNLHALQVGYDAADTSTVDAHFNDLSGCTYGIITTATTIAADLEKNWWGTTDAATISGLAPGLAAVDFDPYLLTANIHTAFSGNRLADMQDTDGGWGWPLTAPPTYKNIHGPITMGLAKAYRATSDPDLKAALQDAGTFFLTKTNDFSPPDGYAAVELDSILGGTTYTDHVWNNYYTPLADGTYDHKGEGTLYDTVGYLQYVHDRRASIPNLAAWDIGMGLVAAATAGVTGADLDAWIAATKDEINLLDGTDDFDVIGLAGALYGLAFVGEEFDPTAGEHAAAGSLADLAGILASYQITETGGFAWNSLYVTPGECNEWAQDTAYAVLALTEVGGHESEVAAAVDYLLSVQLNTGGWENACMPAESGENNELSAEGSWAILAGRSAELTLVPDFDCYTSGATVTVELWMTGVTQDIVGGQFFFDYDTGLLDLVDAVEGPLFDFDLLSEDVDGEVEYSVFINAPGSITGDALIATLTFDAVADICAATGVITWRANDPPTRLSGSQGQPVYLDLTAMDVIDDEAPVISCPTVPPVQCPDGVPAAYGDLAAFLADGGAASDNCSTTLILSLTSDTGLVGGGCGGTVTRIYRVTDYCGNWAECSQVITVDDTTDPVVSCPPLVSIECSDDTSPATTGWPTVTDNCDLAPDLDWSDSSTPGACPQEEVITRTWTATDDCANVGTCVQTITVQDTTPPAITCPDDVVAYADAGTCSATLPTTTCYGDITFTPGFAAQHFDDVYNLTAGDLVLTYTVDMSQITQTAAYETPYVEVGLREVGAGDFNPGTSGVHPGGAGGWMTSLVGDLATDPVFLDLDDKHNLGAAGGMGEGSYDATDPDTVVVPPFGSFNNVHIWYDRDGVDEWQAADPWNVDGGNYNTGGVYEVEIHYHAISATQGTMFSTVNGMQPGFDTTGDGTIDTYPAGIQFTGDMTQMQIFSGAWYTGGAGGNVEVTDICADYQPGATATDNCDPSPVITWVRSDGKTSLDDPYDVADSPITITWTATDACGNSEPCDQTVTVEAFSEMVVGLSLNGSVVSPLTRCITFELFDCGGAGTPTVVEQEVEFTGGAATGVTVLVPCGTYTCVTARDKLHTLRRTLDSLTVVGTQYEASFTTPLIGGNLNDDEWIDILDYGVFSWQWHVTTSGDTDCSDVYPHADIDGNGIVDSPDFTFIQISYLEGNDPDCCSGPNPLGGSQPVTAISVKDLIARGLGELAAGDLNHDGWLDQQDIVAFMSGTEPHQLGVGGMSKHLSHNQR